MITNLLSKKVLLLNSSYEPIMVISGKRAILMIVANKADIIEKTEYIIRSSKFKLSFPSVVKLRSFIYINFKNIPLTRKNIIKRDNCTCQYCGKVTKSVTIDHVIPKDKNGKDLWSNLVTACNKCNSRKSNKYLSDTNMELLRKPVKPTYLYHLQKYVKKDNCLWKPYLFMENN
jgi:hypothetical protein